MRIEREGDLRAAEAPERARGNLVGVDQARAGADVLHPVQIVQAQRRHQDDLGGEPAVGAVVAVDHRVLGGEQAFAVRAHPELDARGHAGARAEEVHDARVHQAHRRAAGEREPRGDVEVGVLGELAAEGAADQAQDQPFPVVRPVRIVAHKICLLIPGRSGISEANNMPRPGASAVRTGAAGA